MALVLHCQFYGNLTSLESYCLGWEVAQRELNVLYVHLHSLIFQRYTKLSLKRNSMKWTMHMCLLQPQFIGTRYKKKKHKMQDCVTLPATDQNCCVEFFSLSAKADFVFIKVLFSSSIKCWGCADLRNEPQSKIYFWNSWSLKCSTCFVWFGGFQILSALLVCLTVWKFRSW